MQKVELYLNYADWLKLRELAKQIDIARGSKTVPSVASVIKTIVLSSDYMQCLISNTSKLKLD